MAGTRIGTGPRATDALRLAAVAVLIGCGGDEAGVADSGASTDGSTKVVADATFLGPHSPDGAGGAGGLGEADGAFDGGSPEDGEVADTAVAPDGPACPASRPDAGDPCDGPSTCRYPVTCGLESVACSTASSYWAVTTMSACSGACPAEEPTAVGDACEASGKCSYPSACGAEDIVFCDGNGAVQAIMLGKCPSCPTQEPTPLSACTPVLSCSYPNSCGGMDLATCDKGATSWVVLRGDCEK